MTSRTTHQRGFLSFLLSWGTVLVALLAYLMFWPVPIEPQAWRSKPSPGHVGSHAVNQRLVGLQTLPLGEHHEGPEHIVVRGERLYTALGNGDVVRLDTGSGQLETLVNTGGRPLGLDLSADGRTLYIADAHKGLLSLNLQGGKNPFRSLLTEVDTPVRNDRIRYADGVAVDARGGVWLTDASRRFDAQAVGGTFEASVLDILEHSCTGRLLAFDPQTVRAREVLTGLCFPNGLVFSRDGRFLWVAETGTYRIVRIELGRLAALGVGGAAPNLSLALSQGAAQVMLDNLPGYPDNLTRGEEGRIWVGLTKPRSPVVDFAADKPWFRAAILRLPRAWWPVPKPYGHVLAFDEQGRVVDDLQDPQGTYPETTSATESGGRLYIQSLHARGVGWMNYRGPAKP